MASLDTITILDPYVCINIDKVVELYYFCANT